MLSTEHYIYSTMNGPIPSPMSHSHPTPFRPYELDSEHRKESELSRDSNASLESTHKYPDYCRTLTVRDANGTVKELVFPKALDLDRPKRARTTFSAEQLYQLEREFQRNQYLVGRERTDLASRLQLSETQVKVWFQNRRTKYKRDRQREQDDTKANAESIAACNILRILETTPASSAPAPAVPHGHFLPPPPPPLGMPINHMYYSS